MRRGIYDFVLVGLVLVFTFLASSFAVRNSDFWLHLAGGRLLAEGRYQFGVDPFAFTTENHYWANQSWLFDVLVFLLYNHFGGTILVVLKALLISLLAIVLMRVRRPLSGMSWPAACTLLAVLAMSPQLLLQSTCLSYVFVGLTLWLLVRPRELSATLRQQLRHDAPVLLLFVLWVNMDSWFLLGPLLVGLFWLGERLFPNRSVGDAILYTPGWLWGASLAVCFLNPHHAHAFTLPVELMPLPDALRHDVRFEPLHSTPWRMIRYYHPLAGVNWASCAYLVLLAVGALSFPLNTRNVVGWRLLVWLTFGGLSAWVSRTIPFFVIVAAPITALNLQDALSRFKTGSERVEAPSARSRLGRLLRGTPHFSLVLSSMALIILAWPGWLQGFQNAGRHVAWTVQPDSSLRRSAERLHIWHQQGKLSVGRGFLAHPDLVHYCAWFCPEEKGFLDRRLQLFGSVADTYEEICRALNLGLATPGSRPRDSWRSNLRDWGITHLVLYDPSLPRLFPSLQQLATEKSDWTLLEVEGQALLVGWRDGERTLPEGLPPFNAERL